MTSLPGSLQDSRVDRAHYGTPVNQPSREDQNPFQEIVTNILETPPDSLPSNIRGPPPGNSALGQQNSSTTATGVQEQEEVARHQEVVRLQEGAWQQEEARHQEVHMQQQVAREQELIRHQEMVMRQDVA